MYGPIELERDEKLLCLFLRGNGQNVNHVDPGDFERRMGNSLLKLPEGGISFFRAGTTDYRTIVDCVKRAKTLNRGIASVLVGKVLDLGFQICGDLDVDERHVCVHCNTCNCAKDNCAPHGASCSFISPEDRHAEDDRMRRELANGMQIIIQASHSRTELLRIFATDLRNDIEVANRNETFLHRFQTATKTISSEPSSR
jgi:hypothetical protein